MRLGELIEELEKHNPNSYVHIDNSPVSLCPVEVFSYRGYYEDLAIETMPTRIVGIITLFNFLPKIIASIGSKFTGYKGGEYEMNKGTRVWISNYGEVSNSLVTGVRATEYGHVYLTWEKTE
jgi:hypothetical protein